MRSSVTWFAIKPQGIADAMFMSGAVSGTSAAEEKCAANGSRHDGK